MFGSPSTGVLSSVHAIAFLEFCLFGRISLEYVFCITHRFHYICSMLSLGPLWASGMRPFEKIFDSFTCCLFSQGFTCYVFSGFRNSTPISIHITIQLSLLLLFLKVYTFKTTLWVSIHYQGFKTYISARLTSIARKV